MMTAAGIPLLAVAEPAQADSSVCGAIAAGRVQGLGSRPAHVTLRWRRRTGPQASRSPNAPEPALAPTRSHGNRLVAPATRDSQQPARSAKVTGRRRRECSPSGLPSEEATQAPPTDTSHCNPVPVGGQLSAQPTTTVTSQAFAGQPTNPCTNTSARPTSKACSSTTTRSRSDRVTDPPSSFTSPPAAPRLDASPRITTLLSTPSAPHGLETSSLRESAQP